MILQATQKNTRQTARKVRLIADAVRGNTIEQAIKQLAVMDRRASLVVLKVLRQALANAQHNHGFSLDQLSLKNVIVNEGPTFKRFRAVSRGRAHTILKRSCHITVELEAAEVGKTATTAAAKAAPKKIEDKKTETKKAEAKKPAKKTASKKTAKTETKAAPKKATAKKSKTSSTKTTKKQKS